MFRFRPSLDGGGLKCEHDSQERRYNKMKKDYECIDGMYVTRRTKAKARKDYNEGYTVYIVPSNMAFRSMWHSPSRINKTYNDCENRTFDSLCNEIEFYQCNSESGKYLRFYTMSDSERENKATTY